jgi:hypothetical protein
MSSKTYAICWDGSINNCLEIDDQLSKSDLDYLIYNVAKKEVNRKNWVRAENVRYYGHVHNALKDFEQTNYDIFVFNAGDPVYSDWVGYTKRVETLMSIDPKIDAIAPNMINDLFSNEGSFISKSRLHKNLDLCTHTNGIHFSLSRELALFLKKYMDWAVDAKKLLIPEMTSGWGIDTVFCATAIYRNKKIYRDVSITVFHPNTSSTDNAVGNKEVAVVLDSFKDFCEIEGINSEAIKSIYEIAYKKARERSNYIVDIKNLYLNLEGELSV